MSKCKDNDFLTKFGDRIETIGKDGVMGLMKHTGISINNNINNRNNYQNNCIQYFSETRIHENNNFNSPQHSINSSYWSNKNLNRNNILNSKIESLNTFNNSSNNNILMNKISNLPKFYEKQTKPNTNNENNKQKIKEPLVYSCLMKNNNIINNNICNNNIGNNLQNILDNGYKPYTIKDYNKLNNDVKLGKLGPNIGTKEWNEKQERMQKMSEYGKRLVMEGKGCHVRLSETAEEKHRKLEEIKNMNGKWNLINEYSKSIKDNKKNNIKEQFNRNVNQKLEEKLNDFDYKNYENENKIRTKEKNNINRIYDRRLNNLKNMLF